MKHLLSILAALCVLAAPAAAQTIRTLGYNTTNGQLVTATNVVWTNFFNFSTNTVAAQVRTNLGLGATWLTNTNVTNFRTAVGLGGTNVVTFYRVETDGVFVSDGNVIETDGEIALQGAFRFDEPLLFNAPAATRTTLSLGLPALTNTSNVTMMRALAGSTNTNAPVSGSVELSDGVLSWLLTFSNGILVNLTEQ
jgi:hypothetical protein